jgi:hypothetical protein
MSMMLSMMMPLTFLQPKHKYIENM